ncbi:MAG: cytochrome c3 family protein [Elusimicrobia bacterium]|nr:cytochrome c3 family protein [Elusimicrobiota bacterium]
MTILSVLFAAFLPFQCHAAPVKDQCVICHATLGDSHQAILKSFSRDIHREVGLSCSSCHGGDSSSDDAGQAMGAEAGFVGAPTRAETPKFCGKCHSDPSAMKKYNPSLSVDQEVKYFTSVHGKKLQAGDSKVAVCTSCHTSHSIRPAKDPSSTVYSKNIPQTCGKCHSDAKLMGSYKLPADQVAKYTGSVHGKALLERGDTAAPVCNTCHGNHGAVPPGVENIGHVCGMCHAHNEEFFKAGPMAKAWEKRKFHICSTCHNHHDIQHPTPALLSSDNGVCRKCHLAGSAQSKAAGAMKAKVDEIEGSYKAAEKSILTAEEKGLDMAEARDLWDSARMSLFQAKTAVHAFRPEKVAEAADPGIEATAKARKSADEAVHEFGQRRVGLGIASLFLTLLALGLYLKVRDLESGQG